jgi:hypothetical protein
MIKPTPEEVKTYALLIGFNLDGEYFCEYNTARGWMIGKTPMKDWKACVRMWKRNAEIKQPEQKKIVPQLYNEDVPPESELLTWADIQQMKGK